MVTKAERQLAGPPALEQVTESPFYIPMTGPAARPRRTLKHDDTFIVLDSHGDIGASAGGPDGLFNADTRYLARLELVLDDAAAAAGLESARRQFRADGRSHQSGHLSRATASCCRRT